MKKLIAFTLSLSMYWPCAKCQYVHLKLQRQIDSTFRLKMEEAKVPGAIFAMVNRDSIVMSRGYGLSNLDTKVAVDPQNTAFRVASVSKAVSATMIMKMVQNGAIDLDEDINKYLRSFKIKESYTQPVTFRHLLSHSSGFDTEGPGRRTLDADKMETMPVYFSKHMTKRVAPPGKILMYSNHAGSLGGAIVEDMTMEPFDKLMKKHLFEPLKMVNSGFVKHDLSTREVAQGYFFQNDQFVEAPFEYTRTIAGSMLMTTANDMANFLRMHLNGGKFNGTIYLEEHIASLMHNVQFKGFENMAGTTLGFYEMTANGKRIITHSGGFDGFMSQVYFLLDEGIAFFMAFNQRQGGAQVNRDVRQLIFDHFIPVDSTAKYRAEPIVSTPLEPYTGTYLSTGVAQKNISKADAFPGKFQWKIEKGKGDTLIAFGYPYVSIGKHLFRQANEQNSYLKFVEDQRGRIRLVTFGGFFTTHRKLKWFELASFQIIALAFCTLIFLVSIGISIARHFRKKGMIVPIKKQFNILSFTAIGLFVLFIVATALLPGPNRYGVPKSFEAALVLPIIGALASLPLPFLAGKSWMSDRLTKWEKSRISLVTLALFLLIWILWFWQLLGFNY